MKRGNKRVYIIVVVIALILIIGGFSVRFFKSHSTNENNTMNAMLDINKYGAVSDKTALYIEPDLNSDILYDINAAEEFIILSDKDYKDSVGNSFVKVLYSDDLGRIYSGYINKNAIVDSDDTVIEDVVEEEKKEVTVLFDTDGGDSIPNQTIVLGNKAVKPADPKKYGYNFAGWYLNDNPYDFNSSVSDNIILKAKWNPKQFVVKFYYNDGNVKYEKVYMDQTVKKPEDVTLPGVKSVSWELDGKKFDFNTKITDNILLKSVYKYDFSNMDTCAKTGTIMNGSTSNKDGFKIYRCVTDYGFNYTTHGKDANYNARSGQGFAVTKDYAYINYPIFGAWTTAPDKNFPKMFMNFVHRIDKKTGQLSTAWIRYGGHGQSFDATEENGQDLLYYNAYPYKSTADIGGTTWYGSFYRGLAYNTFKKSGDFLIPIDAFIFDSNGKYFASLSGNNYSGDNSDNGQKMLKVEKNTVNNGGGGIYNPDVAVDEKNGLLALVSSRKVFIHDLKKLQSKNKNSLIRTINFPDKTGKQGVDLIKNSLYIWNEKKVKVGGVDKNVGIFRLDVYNVSEKNNGKVVKPYLSAEIDLSSYYKEKAGNIENYYRNLAETYKTVDAKRYQSFINKANYYKNNFLDYCEAEGMSIYNSKVYLMVMCRDTSPEYSKGDVYQLVWN